MHLKITDIFYGQHNNLETSFPVPPMSRENSGGNYPGKGQVRRRGVYE